MSPARAAEAGLTSTVTFPIGNIAPQGSVIKSTSIDPSVVDEHGVYRHIGRAKVFTLNVKPSVRSSQAAFRLVTSWC